MTNDHTTRLLTQAMQFAEQQETLANRQRDLHLIRRAAQEARRNLPATDAELELRGEQSKLAKQRKTLLSEITER